MKVEHMEEVKTLSKSRVAVISSVIVLAIIVLLLGVRAFGQPLPDKNKITDITISYEFSDKTATVSDKEAFFAAVKIEDWKPARNYEEKFAAVAYITFSPKNIRVQVLGCDGNFTYLDVDGKVYTAPSYVYEYIMSFETK